MVRIIRSSYLIMNTPLAPASSELATNLSNI